MTYVIAETFVAAVRICMSLGLDPNDQDAVVLCVTSFPWHASCGRPIGDDDHIVYGGRWKSGHWSHATDDAIRGCIQGNPKITVL